MKTVKIKVCPYLARYISIKYHIDSQQFVKITDADLEKFVISLLEPRPAVCPFFLHNLVLILPENFEKSEEYYISEKNQKKISKCFYNLYINELKNYIDFRKEKNKKDALVDIFYDFVEKYDLSQFIDCETFRKQYIRKIKPRKQ